MTLIGVELKRGEREELPNWRPSIVFEFEHGHIRYTATLGVREADSSLAEVFLNAGKVGSLIGALAHDSAILLSLLLQYGCPFDAIRGAVTRNPDGSASGPVGTLLDRLANWEA